jgi:hypothetical protein
MRTFLIAGLMAAGIGFGATSGASAAPVNGTVIGDLATAPVTTVQYYGGYRSYGYSYRSYGYGRYNGYGRYGRGY